MSAARYSRVARVLHWLSAAVIIWAMLSGFAATMLAPAVKEVIAFINVSLTSVFIPVFLFRIMYALLSNEVGGLDLPHPVLVIKKATHFLLYVTTSMVLASGVLMMERPINIFGLVTLPSPLNEGPLTLFFFGIHRYSCIVLSILLAMHVLAVIAHERRGIRVLRRML